MGMQKQEKSSLRMKRKIDILAENTSDLVLYFMEREKYCGQVPSVDR